MTQEAFHITGGNIMRLIKTVLFVATLFLPITVLAHEHTNFYPLEGNHFPNENYREHDYYDDDYGYEKEYRDRDRKKFRHHKKNHAQPGWDVSPRVAKAAANCYRYTLTAQGGKGSARIMSIPGKNYVQVRGNKQGYVCFQGEPTLELGKLGDPGIKVTFTLEGMRKYSFPRGQTGCSYKNHWYRTYWGL